MLDNPKLSKYFTLNEMTKSQTALRLGIDNTPDKQAISNLKRWCLKIGDPVREYYKAPVIVSSGFRSDALNKAAGGHPSSQHRFGEAADFEVLMRTNLEVAQFIRRELEFDQLILELWDGRDPHSGWVHCSYREGNNRRQVLQLVRGRGYLGGLPE